ncbi:MULTISPECIES: hypothetical protein [Pontibacter]|nr:hypothetical protein [Pontibacter mangrovi]TPE41505.1 hypothetical protein FJM65_19080 [Pontibacter mangrovi]
MHEGGGGDGKGKDHDMEMNPEMRQKMLHMHHMQTLWVYWMIIILGVWVLLSPLTFDYGRAVTEPSGGSEVWLSMEERVAFMKWSDIISGALLGLEVAALAVPLGPKTEVYAEWGRVHQVRHYRLTR